MRRTRRALVQPIVHYRVREPPTIRVGFTAGGPQGAHRLIRFPLPVTAEAGLYGHGEKVNVCSHPDNLEIHSDVLRLGTRSPASISRYSRTLTPINHMLPSALHHPPVCGQGRHVQSLDPSLTLPDLLRYREYLLSRSTLSPSSSRSGRRLVYRGVDRAAAIEPRTTVPPPRLLSTAKVPPIASRRSAIP